MAANGFLRLRRESQATQPSHILRPTRTEGEIAIPGAVRTGESPTKSRKADVSPSRRLATGAHSVDRKTKRSRTQVTVWAWESDTRRVCTRISNWTLDNM
ncbi:hypothetical protein QTP88_024183 [Uroleucon formosanum]